MKLILRKVKSHNNGEALFKDCLTKTSQAQNHQRLLSILYNTKDSSSGNTINHKYSCITNSCYYKLIIVAGNAESGDEFLCELKAAYRSCIKEGDSFVLISALADKYMEIYSREKYRKNLKGTKLKTFLSNSGHFSCTEGKVIIVKGI